MRPLPRSPGFLCSFSALERAPSCSKEPTKPLSTKSVRARLCYSLASAYGGKSCGPDRFEEALKDGEELTERLGSINPDEFKKHGGIDDEQYQQLYRDARKDVLEKLNRLCIQVGAQLNKAPELISQS
jgi:hypothetical protein